MAKKPGGDESPDLGEMIQMARKRQMNFAAIIGKDGVAFASDPRKSPDVMWRQAKQQAGGSKGGMGVMNVSGKELQLQFVDDEFPPPLKKAIRKQLAQAGQKLKVVILRADGSREGDDDEDEAEGDDTDIAKDAVTGGPGNGRDADAPERPADAPQAAGPEPQVTAMQAPLDTDGVEQMRAMLSSKYDAIRAGVDRVIEAGHAGATKKAQQLARMFEDARGGADPSRALPILQVIEKFVGGELQKLDKPGGAGKSPGGTLGGTLGEAGSAVAGRAADIAQGVARGAGAVGDKVGQGAASAGDAVGRGIGSVAEKVGEGADKVAGAVGAGIGKAAETVGKVAGSGAEAAGKAVGKGVATVGKAAGGAFAAVGKAVGKGVSSVSKAAGGAVSAVAKAASKGGGKIAGKLGQLGGAIANGIGGLIDKVAKAARAAAMRIAQGARVAAQAASDVAETAVDAVRIAAEAAAGAAEQAQKAVQQVGARAAEMVKAAQDAAAKAAQTAADAKDAADQAVRTAVAAAERAAALAADVVDNAGAKAVAAAEAAAKAAQKAAAEAVTRARNAARDAAEAAQRAADLTLEKIAEAEAAADQVKDRLKNKLDSLSEEVGRVAAGAEDAADTIVQRARAALDEMRRDVEALPTDAGEIGDRLRQAAEQTRAQVEQKLAEAQAAVRAIAERLADEAAERQRAAEAEREAARAQLAEAEAAARAAVALVDATVSELGAEAQAALAAIAQAAEDGRNRARDGAARAGQAVEDAKGVAQAAVAAVAKAVEGYLDRTTTRAAEMALAAAKAAREAAMGGAELVRDSIAKLQDAAEAVKARIRAEAEDMLASAQDYLDEVLSQERRAPDLRGPEAEEMLARAEQAGQALGSFFEDLLARLARMGTLGQDFADRVSALRAEAAAANERIIRAIEATRLTIEQQIAAQIARLRARGEAAIERVESTADKARQAAEEAQTQTEAILRDLIAEAGEEGQRIATPHIERGEAAIQSLLTEAEALRARAEAIRAALAELDGLSREAVQRVLDHISDLAVVQAEQQADLLRANVERMRASLQTDIDTLKSSAEAARRAVEDAAQAEADRIRKTMDGMKSEGEKVLRDPFGPHGVVRDGIARALRSVTDRRDQLGAFGDRIRARLEEAIHDAEQLADAADRDVTAAIDRAIADFLARMEQQERDIAAVITQAEGVHDETKALAEAAAQRLVSAEAELGATRLSPAMAFGERLQVRRVDSRELLTKLRALPGRTDFKAQAEAARASGDTSQLKGSGDLAAGAPGDAHALLDQILAVRDGAQELASVVEEELTSARYALKDRAEECKTIATDMMDQMRGLVAQTKKGVAGAGDTLMASSDATIAALRDMIGEFSGETGAVNSDVEKELEDAQSEIERLIDEGMGCILIDEKLDAGAAEPAPVPGKVTGQTEGVNKKIIDILTEVSSFYDGVTIRVVSGLRSQTKQAEVMYAGWTGHLERGTIYPYLDKTNPTLREELDALVEAGDEKGFVDLMLAKAAWKYISYHLTGDAVDIPTDTDKKILDALGSVLNHIDERNSEGTVCHHFDTKKLVYPITDTVKAGWTK